MSSVIFVFVLCYVCIYVVLHLVLCQVIFVFVLFCMCILQAYEEWSMSGEQEHTFLADKCSGCQRVSLSAGDTFFIPTGM